MVWCLVRHRMCLHDMVLGYAQEHLPLFTAQYLWPQLNYDTATFPLLKVFFSLVFKPVDPK